MNLNEFILWCRLHGLVTRYTELGSGVHKIQIERGRISVVMVYKVEGEGEIIKSTLDARGGYHLSPALSRIVEVFFPS